MGILEKLRPQPRWKHTDPSVRAAAVYELGPDETEALHALAREDAEPRVRRAAVTRTDAPAVLADIAKTDPDEDVRAEAVRGIAGIAAETDDLAQALDAVRQLIALSRSKEIVLVARDSSSADVRAGVVDLVEDQKILSSISRHSRDGATRLRALARLTDPDDIRAVALKAEQTDAAVAALERLSTVDALDDVSQHARNKVAARRARARLRLMTEPAPAAGPVQARMSAEERARALDLLHRAEALVALADPDAAGEGLAAVRLAWAEMQADVDADIDAALVQQFEAASEAVREAIAERRQEREADEERARALAREQADRLAICEEAERLSGPDAADRIAELKVRWDSQPPMALEYAAPLTRRFQDACRTYEDRERRRQLAAAAVGRLGTLATELEQLVSSDQPLEEVIARWRGLRRDADVLREHAEANPAATERLERAIVVLEEREHHQVEVRSRRQQEALRRLQQLVHHLDAMAAGVQVSLKAGMRALRDIQAALDERVSLPSKKDWQEIQARLEAARAALTPRVHELRDADEWQRWANLQVQEQLCKEMEALKESPDAEGAARRMRELQGRWKEVALAPPAKGELMWRRFKTAQDEVFARAAPHFAAQAEERASNLAKKQALCERAEALAGSTDWVKTASALQGLQADWKTVGAVPRGHEKAVWERFRAACGRFFTRRQEDLKIRKEAWTANLTAKEDLCAKAEALADSTDWDAAASQVRQLQAQWKTTGPVRKSKSDVVWERFRTACDRFFDRYKHRDQLELSAKAAPRDAVIRELEQLAPAAGAEAGAAPAPDGLAAVIQQARERWQQAPELPRHMQQDLAARYHEAVSRLVAAWPSAFAGTDLDPDVTRKRMEKLVERVEDLLSASPQRARPLSPAELLAERWRERLASNTIAGGKAESEESRWRAAEQDVKSAQAQWTRLGPVPQDVAGPLNEQFQRACRRFFDLRRKAS